MKGVYVFLAEGFEEIEALATVDILRRGGVEATTVSINHDRTVRGAHGIPVIADWNRDEFDGKVILGSSPEDAMIFPGGLPGASNLAEDEFLMALMQKHFSEGGTVAAICAAPGLVLSQLNGIAGAEVTCFDGFETYLEKAGAHFSPKPAICSGRIITGRSAGWALEFGLKIVEKVRPEKVDEVRHALYLKTE